MIPHKCPWSSNMLRMQQFVTVKCQNVENKRPHQLVKTTEPSNSAALPCVLLQVLCLLPPCFPSVLCSHWQPLVTAVTVARSTCHTAACELADRSTYLTCGVSLRCLRGVGDRASEEGQHVEKRSTSGKSGLKSCGGNFAEGPIMVRPVCGTFVTNNTTPLYSCIIINMDYLCYDCTTRCPARD